MISPWVKSLVAHCRKVLAEQRRRKPESPLGIGYWLKKRGKKA